MPRKKMQILAEKIREMLDSHVLVVVEDYQSGIRTGYLLSLEDWPKQTLNDDDLIAYLEEKGVEISIPLDTFTINRP